MSDSVYIPLYFKTLEGDMPPISGRCRAATNSRWGSIQCSRRGGAGPNGWLCPQHNMQGQKNGIEIEQEKVA